MKPGRYLLWTLLFTLLFPSIIFAEDSSPRRLYVVNSGTASVSVIDAESGNHINTIKVGKWPAGITVSPDRKKIYIMNSSRESSSVSVIDASSNNVIDTIRTGIGPMHMAIDARTKFAYITDTGDIDKKSVTIADLADNTVKAKIRFKSIEPFETVIVPEKQRAYIVVSGGYFVSVIDLVTYMKTARIPVGKLPLGLAYSPASRNIYVTSHDDNNISVINTDTNKVVRTIQTGKNPWYIAVDAPSDRIYITCAGDNSVTVIDTKQDIVAGVIQVGNSPRGISIDSGAKKAYVANKLDHSISVIDLTSNSVIRTIQLEKNAHPWGIAVY